MTNILEKYHDKFLGMGGELLSSVLQVEAEEREHGQSYGTKRVRQSIVHTRADVVVLVYHLAQVHKQSLKTSRRLEVIIVILLAWSVVLLLT